MGAVKVSAVVLAAGSNKRFGGERSKLLAEWRSRTLIEYVIDAANGARMAGIVTEVLVVAATDAARIKAIAVAEGCRVVHPPPSTPISTSLKTAVASLAPGAEGAVVLLGDQPLVTHHIVRAVVEASRGSPQALVRAHYRGTADPVSHPFYIGRNHFGLVHQLDGEIGFRAAEERLGLRCKDVWFDGGNPDVDHRFDLDRLN